MLKKPLHYSIRTPDLLLQRNQFFDRRDLFSQYFLFLYNHINGMFNLNYS